MGSDPMFQGRVVRRHAGVAWQREHRFTEMPAGEESARLEDDR